MELLKNLKEKSRQRSTLESNGKYMLWLDFDNLSIKEAMEILDDVRANVPKKYKEKQVRVYTKGSFWL